MASKKKLKKVIGMLQHALLGMSGFLQVLDRQRQEALLREFQTSDRTITTMLRDEMEQGLGDGKDD